MIASVDSVARNLSRSPKELAFWLRQCSKAWLQVDKSALTVAVREELENAFLTFSEAIKLEINASMEEYEAALMGEIDFPMVSQEAVKEARKYLARFVELSLKKNGIEVTPGLRQKMTNILLLTLRKV